jgi:hypothetical protein
MAGSKRDVEGLAGERRGGPSRLKSQGAAAHATHTDEIAAAHDAEARGVAAQNGSRRPQGAATQAAFIAHSQKAPPPAGPDLIRQHELIEKVRSYDPLVDEDLLNRAYVFSMVAHGDQTRKSGDPYFIHPLAVAGILADLKADPASVVTALLHDVVEDTDVTVDDIAARFGPEIADLVDGVTKLS